MMSKRKCDPTGLAAPSFKKRRRTLPSDISEVSSNCTMPTTSSSSSTTSETVGFAIPPKMVYKINLQHSKRFYEGSTFSVVADCDVSSGKLNSRYAVITKQQFKSPSSSTVGYVYTCACAEGIDQHERLRVTNKVIEEDFYDFYYRETTLQCMHAAMTEILLPCDILSYSAEHEDPEDNPDVVLVEPLSDDPLLVGVVSGDSVSLIQRNRRTKHLICSCRHGIQQDCCHKKAYRNWCSEQDVSLDITIEHINTTSHFGSISYAEIPYPLPEDLQQTYIEYETGVRALPHNLVPEIPASGPHQTCPNGFAWLENDPVEEGWTTSVAIVYKEGLSVESVSIDGCQYPIQVYHRFCTGGCRCRLDYDGQKDLLFNLNNRDLVYYGALFNYLHHMLEGRNPLAACHRSYQHTHMALSGLRCISIAKLRLAWNAFARLLVMPLGELFCCPECGPEPKVVVCDGTSLGCNKTLLNSLPHDPVSEEGNIQGTLYKDRTFITDNSARKLLNQYCNDHLSAPELETLLPLLETTSPLSFVNFVASLHPDRNLPKFIVPAKYKQFVKDIASPGPACALFQGAVDEDLNYLETVLGSGEPIFTSQYSHVIAFLQRKFRIFFEFLFASKEGDQVPVIAQNLLLDIIKIGRKAYNAPGERSYTAAGVEEMIQGTHCFPSLPKLHRDGKYAINQRDVEMQCRQASACRKFTKGHPTLSAGIFTIYCPHGVCYGFEMMRKNESPQVPFNIFKTRFKRAPEVVVYDNACKLHAYCLNREPDFFRNTMFLVDRMHWHNHRSCSRGYCMDMYKTRVDLKSTNSQVNEQANAGISRIKGQLAYMLPDNFMFHGALFLALKNKVKIQKVTG